MMQGSALAAIFVLGLSLAGGAAAQTPARGQPDWPCRQVRVANLSLGGVWTGPSIDAAQKIWRDDPAIYDLALRISARRTPIEEAERLIVDFAKRAGDKTAGDETAPDRRKERLTMLFAGVYDRLDSERHEVVEGLDRFGRRLKDMAEQARDETQALRDRQDKAPADAVKIKELSDALQWRLRLFEEQRRMVGFVCESPALIEQRLGALARAILAALN